MFWKRKQQPIEQPVVDHHLSDTPIELRVKIVDNEFVIELRWIPIPYSNNEATLVMAKVIIQMVCSSFCDDYIKVAKIAANNYGSIFGQKHVADLVAIGLDDFLRKKSSTEPVVTPLKAFVPRKLD